MGKEEPIGGAAGGYRGVPSPGNQLSHWELSHDFYPARTRNGHRTPEHAISAAYIALTSKTKMLAARTIARPARRLCAAPQCVSLARSLSTTPAIKAQHVSSSEAAPGKAAPKKRKPLTQEQRDFLSSAV